MLQRIASHNIKAVQYCPLYMILEVQFEGENNTYQYFDVPEEVWYNMKNAGDIDLFFNSQIMFRYCMAYHSVGNRNVVD